MATPPKKRAGRPAKPASERAETFSIRLTPDLRAKIEAAAADSGRSLTSEIVWRLEASVADDAGGGRLLDHRFREWESIILRMSDLQSKRAAVDLAISSDSGKEATRRTLLHQKALLDQEFAQLNESAKRLVEDMNHYIQGLSTRAQELMKLLVVVADANGALQ